MGKLKGCGGRERGDMLRIYIELVLWRGVESGETGFRFVSSLH